MEKYTVGEKLGSGSYAEVFRCTEKSTGTKYALKMLSKAKAGPKGLQQAASEVHILRALNHKGIIGLHDTFQTADHLCMVLEVVEGGEVFDRIVQLKHYSEKTAAKLVRNMVEAMAYMNSQGIAHRDIKPENLMLRSKVAEGAELTDAILSDVKLVDFGFACRFADKPFTECCGTPNFIAPEVLKYGLFKTRPTGYDEKCDVWSTGVLAYILLCGYPPFHDKSRTQMFRKICDGRFHFHSGTVWEKISSTAKDFVTRCMHREPEGRLTFDDALRHPWLSGVVPDMHLSEAQSELVEFNARERIRGAVLGICAPIRMLYLARASAMGMKPNSGLEAMLLEMTEQTRESVDLSSNYLGLKGVRMFVEVLTNLPCRTLNLRATEIDNDGATVLAPAFRAHKTLQSIDLRGNPISALGVRMLLNAIQANPRITTLQLDFTECPAYQAKIQVRGGVWWCVVCGVHCCTVCTVLCVCVSGGASSTLHDQLTRNRARMAAAAAATPVASATAPPGAAAPAVPAV